MKLHVIIAQRKESYEGEHGPEALEAATEHDVDENPEWLAGKLHLAKSASYYESVEIVTIEVSYAQIMNILRPKNGIRGEIV